MESEENKSFEDRHPAIQWLHAYSDHHNKTLARKDSKPEDFQFGVGAAWIRLAYDPYTISDNIELQDIIRERLLFKDFQAARHELYVAALFVAAGFEVKFENESDNSRKHPEFIATDKKLGKMLPLKQKAGAVKV